MSVDAVKNKKRKKQVDRVVRVVSVVIIENCKRKIEFRVVRAVSGEK